MAAPADARLTAAAPASTPAPGAPSHGAAALPLAAAGLAGLVVVTILAWRGALAAARRRGARPRLPRLGERRVRAIGWSTAGFVVALVGAALVVAPLPALLGVAGVALAVLGLGAIEEPRWAIVVSIGLVVSFVPDAIGGHTVLPGSSGVAALLAGSLLVRRALGRPSPRLVPEAWLFAALLLVIGVSGLFAPDMGHSLTVLVRQAKYVLLAILLLGLIDTAEWMRRVAWAIVVAAAGLALLSLFQQGTHSYTSDYFGLARVGVDTGIHRSKGPLDPNYFAQILLVACALALYLGLSARRPGVRRLAYGCVALCLGAMVLTYSRGGFIALLVGAITVALLRHVRLWIPVAALVAVVAVGTLALPPDVKARFTHVLPVPGGGSSLAESQDTSVADRYTVNRVAVAMIVTHPLIGVGPGNYPDVYPSYAARLGFDDRQLIGGITEEQAQRPHSLYLETLAELGVAGFGVLAAILVLAGRSALRGRSRLPPRDALVAEGTFVALVVYFTAAITLHDAYPQYLWVVVGLAFLPGHVAARREAAARA